MRRILVMALSALMLCGIQVSAYAQAKKAAADSKANTPSSEVEERIKNLVQERFGERPNSVEATPVNGLFEVVIGTDIIYVDAFVNYALAGKLLDARTRADLTQAKKDQLLKVDYAKLPLDKAVKLKMGNGSRQFVTFEDPNCPYCRRLHAELAKMKDVTVYVFLLPILSSDSMEKSKAIWCAKDRAAAWNAVMIEGKSLPAAPENCKHPLQDNLALGQKYEINGTPTLIFTDGTRAPGAVPIEEIERRLGGKKS